MLKLQIGKPVYNGYNLSHHSGKTCFVRGAIDGETVLCTVTKEKKTYRFCKVVKVLEASPARVTPPCCVYGKCGGCQYLHIRYQTQLEIKQQIAQEVFSPYPVNKIVESPDQLRYRNKALIPHKKRLFGFYREKSNKIIEFSDCVLQPVKVNRTVELIRKNFRDDKLVKGIIIRHTSEDKLLLCLIVKEKRSRFRKRLLRLASKNRGLIDQCWISLSPGNSNYLLDGDNTPVDFRNNTLTLYERLKGKSFELGPTNFFQINTGVTQLLYSHIESFIGNHSKNLIDAYCGSGTIGIFLSDRINGKITFIENFPASLQLLKKNLSTNCIRDYSIIPEKFENTDILKNAGSDAVLIIDPPRAGLHENAISRIIKQKPEKIIYVSCNPATLKRDINRLEAVYKVNEISIFDMFPQTFHFESIAVLEAKN